MVKLAQTIVAGVVAALSVAAPALAEPDHFILTEVNTLVQARIDPIVDGGSIGSHVHNIMGASNFGSKLRYPNDQIAGSECTTVLVNDDRSNYWTPTMYYIHDNGTYEAMLAGARIYYFLKNPDKIQPWPKGMRIVSGTAMSRDESTIQSQGVDLTCGETPGTRHLPNGTSHDYCDSIHAGIYFPSCGWANQSLDSWDHFSHLTWPIQRGGGQEWIDVNGENCPDTHPIKYPTMFIQHFYRFDQFRPWRKGRNNVVFSNGDMLGSSFHGDFVMGWKDGVLANAIDQCKSPHGPIEALQQCAPLAASLNISEARNCAYQGMIPNEDVGIYRAIDKLPGCNPIWKTGDGDSKPKCDSAPAEPGWVKPNVGFVHGFLTRLPLYLPNVVPSDLTFNWDAVWKAGAWGLYGSDNSTIQQPADQNAQTDQPNDSVAGNPVNNAGAMTRRSTPPSSSSSNKATPVFTYKGMPTNIDMLGNVIKNNAAKPAATGAALFNAVDNASALGNATSATGSSTSSAASSGAASAASSAASSGAASAASSGAASAASSGVSSAASAASSGAASSGAISSDAAPAESAPASSSAASAASSAETSAVSSAASGASETAAWNEPTKTPKTTKGKGKKCRSKKTRRHNAARRRLSAHH